MKKTYLEAEMLFSHQGYQELAKSKDKNIAKLRLDVAEIKTLIMNNLKDYFQFKSEIVDRYSDKIDGVPVVKDNGTPKIQPNVIPRMNNEIKEIASKELEFQGISVDLSKEKYSGLSTQEYEFLLMLMEPKDA